MEFARKIKTIEMILKRHNIGFSSLPNNDFTIGKNKHNAVFIIGALVGMVFNFVTALLLLIFGSLYSIFCIAAGIYCLFFAYTKWNQGKANKRDITIKDGSITITEPKGTTQSFIKKDVENIRIHFEENEDLVIGKLIIEGSHSHPVELLRLIKHPEYLKDDLTKIAEVINIKLDKKAKKNVITA